MNFKLIDSGKLKVFATDVKAELPEMTYDAMCKVFGASNGAPSVDGKVSTAWGIEFDDGEQVKIYDWKMTKLHDPDFPSVEDFRNAPYAWHVRGTETGVAHAKETIMEYAKANAVSLDELFGEVSGDVRELLSKLLGVSDDTEIKVVGKMPRDLEEMVRAKVKELRDTPDDKIKDQLSVSDLDRKEGATPEWLVSLQEPSYKYASALHRFSVDYVETHFPEWTTTQRIMWAGLAATVELNKAAKGIMGGAIKRALESIDGIDDESEAATRFQTTIDVVIDIYVATLKSMMREHATEIMGILEKGAAE